MKVSRRGSVQSAVCSLQHSCLHRPIPESADIKSCAAPWGTCNQRVRAVCNLCSLTTATTRHSSSWRTVEIRLLHFAILPEKTQVMMKICWITLPMIRSCLGQHFKVEDFAAVQTENLALLFQLLKNGFYILLRDEMLQVFGDFQFSCMCTYIFLSNRWQQRLCLDTSQLATAHAKYLLNNVQFKQTHWRDG